LYAAIILFIILNFEGLNFLKEAPLELEKDLFNIEEYNFVMLLIEYLDLKVCHIEEICKFIFEAD